MRVIISGATDNRDNMGRFTRVHKSWSLERFDDGYIDADGRFRVYYPNHPRAYKGGYVLRAIVAYETYHGTSVPPDMDIHHIDGNRLKDTEENLEQVPLKTEHQKFLEKDLIKPELEKKKEVLSRPDWQIELAEQLKGWKKDLMRL